MIDIGAIIIPFSERSETLAIKTFIYEEVKKRAGETEISCPKKLKNMCVIKQEINRTESNLVDELDKLIIPCPICNRMYHRVAAHAQAKHGISIHQFKETFHYTTATQACAYRLLRLYGGRSDIYIEQIYKGHGQSDYITIDGNAPETPVWNSFLGTRKAVTHLRGGRTFGVLFWDYHTRVLVFDFDFYPGTPISNQQLYVERIFDPLYKLQIPRKCIHVLKSGLKGFHVDLYFDKFMPTQTLLTFAKHVVKKAGLDGLEPCVKVELRPENPIGGRGVRLPLGVHIATGERMMYLDSHFKPAPNQFHYLLYQTKQISRDDFFKYTYPKVIQQEQFIRKQEQIERQLGLSIVDCRLMIERTINNHKSSIINPKAPHSEFRRHYTREELDDFYENGLSSFGTRHNVTLGLAIRLKEQGHSVSPAKRQASVNSQKEVRELLYEWSRKKAPPYSQSTLKARIEDVNAIVKYVFEKDCHLDEPEDSQWLITDSDLVTILNYHYLTLAEQKTLAIIFMIRRHFGQDAYYPQQLCATLLGVDVRTVRNHIKKFINLSILALTYRGNSFFMHSNKYKIRDFKEDYTFAFAFPKAQVNGETFVKAMKRIVSEKLMKARYSYYLRKVRLNPVRRQDGKMARWQEKTTAPLPSSPLAFLVHPSIPSPLTIETPKIGDNSQQEKLVARKIFESLSPIIAIFRLVRSVKRKHGSYLGKQIFRDVAYYMKC